MGDIKKIKKKYSRPSHPWRITRIQEEGKICKEYGIPQKTELWKAGATLNSFKNQAKKLAALTTPQATKERENLFNKMKALGLAKDGDTLDAVLSVTLNDILNRRLQTLVYKKGYAKSMKQARQMITHRHVLIAGKLLTSPAYLVRVGEETAIEISPKSPFYAADHPERAKEAAKKVEKPKQERRPQRRGGRR